MTTSRAEIGREIPKNLQYLKDREQAFAELLEVFTNITAGKEFVLRLPDATKKYSQFLSVSDREPLIKAVDDRNLQFFTPSEKKKAWAKILSVVMSSGANRCDVKSPGIGEVKRLIPLSPFNDNDIVAHVTAHSIISPNDVLQATMHHEHYLAVRRLVYEAIIRNSEKSQRADICMGAEYFVAGKILWNVNYLMWESVSSELNPYILQVVKPIDRRG